MSPDEGLLATLPAIVTAVFGYLAARVQFRRRPGEGSEAIAVAFSTLVDQLRAENTANLERIRTLREDAHKIRGQLARLQAYAQALFRHLARLEEQVVALGEKPALRPNLPDWEFGAQR